MVQLIAALFFTAALFAAVGVIAVTLQKSGGQILAALRGVVPAADLPQGRAPRAKPVRGATQPLRAVPTRRIAA